MELLVTFNYAIAYMNSMIQEKTGVSAGEILFGRSPNLPSDISFTPITSLSDDREGYVKQLKRDLQDIRQKLSRVLGQNANQSENPFSVGEKVIVAILPHERADKLMAKWKGPFTVTKIPNRFQIEYLDGTIARLTHISYVKKYNERCQFAERVVLPRSKRVSRVKSWVRMARLRLIAGKGKDKVRMVVPSAKAIIEKWPVKNGPIRVKVISDGEPLPSELQAIADAIGPDSWIEGHVLVDLCKQRSEEGGSGCYAPGEIYSSPVSLTFGCDTPEEVAEPPVLHLPSPGSPIMPVVQVSQFSWHYSDKHGLYNMKHRFGRSNKQINSVFLSPLSQAPLVSKVRLLRVTRKIGQQERARGERFSVSMFKSLSKGERNVTSSSIPAKNQRDSNMLYSGKCNAGMGIDSPKHSHMDNIHIISNCEGQEKEKERENPFTGRIGNNDIIVSSKSDVTPPDTVSVEKTSRIVARKRFLTTEYSVLSLIDNFRKRWMAFKGLISLLVIRFITMFSMLGEITGISRCEGKRLIGNSMEYVSSEELGNVRTPFPFYIFFKCLSTILIFQRKFWNYDIIYLV